MKNERFWNKVKRGPGCWEWTAYTSGGGYGYYSLNGKDHRAHRLVYEMGHGPIPNGMKVCHTCDNPPCVRPSHLFIGTQKDNSLDAHKKGRLYTKLTPKQIEQIRADTRTLRKIAADYDVCFTTVGRIKKKETWKHIK